ncbi:MAG: hypothetical protein JWP18_1641 [Solirubrobacterales bacterium]|nr:hypothetical protein [Solirubrobacterales bacterium]
MPPCACRTASATSTGSRGWARGCPRSFVTQRQFDILAELGCTYAQG